MTITTPNDRTPLPPIRRNHRQAAATAAAVLFGLLGFSLAQLHATTLARMELADLVRQSDYIVRARCLTTATESGSGQVWTLSTFAVTEAWKGNPPSPFTVRLPGGELPGMRVAVEGAPRFDPGEDVVLFLLAGAAGRMNVVGWLQGTFRVLPNPRTGSAEAVQDTAGLLVLDAHSGASSPGARRQLPLASLRAAVEAAIRKVPQ